MKKIIILFVLVILFFVPATAILHAEEITTTEETTTTTSPLEDTTTTTVAGDTTTTLVTEETTTTNLPKPFSTGILPGNRFYFLKTWWRGLKLGFIFNPVKKAEEEANIAEDTLQEVAQVAVRSKRADALRKAVENYNRHVNALKNKLESLKGTSDNPNIDKLLDRLTKLQVNHQKLFDRLINHSSDLKQLRQQTDKIMNQDIPLWQLRRESKGKFIPRLEKKIEKSQSTVPQLLKEIHRLDILESTKERLDNLNSSQLTSKEKEKLNLWKQRIEEKIKIQKRTLKKKGIASSTIDTLIKKYSSSYSPRKLRRLPLQKPHFVHSPLANPPAGNHGNK